ncbi:MAG: chromosome segregation protein SMC [Acutalibacteraceae bacterium]
MRLKSIEIQGFKSFPDKTRLTFDQDITAVIGPNGSGKSNISDAIRWVLGEQSNKQLRGKSMEDVIFTGTAKRKALGFAEVSITMDNTGRELQFDNDNVTVTRRYFRSGESEYKINGNTVRLKDIHELFMDTGLGRDGYSMIGQGRIDEIVGSKSDERRDIFEEAAGISKYRYRRLEAERKLAHSEDNLVRLRDIMAELEVRVKPLKEQSEKAKEFLSVSGEKKQLEIGLWLHSLNKYNEQLKNQDEKITLAKAQYEKLERELTELIAKSDISAIESNKLSAQIDAIRREAAKADEQTSEIKGQIAVLNNNILHNDENIERLQSEIETANTDDATLEKEISEKQTLIADLEKKSALKTDELNSELENLASVSDDSGDFSEKISEKNTKLNELGEKISECKVELVSAKTAVSEIDNNFDDFDETVKKINDYLEDVKIEMEECNADIDDCDKTIEECSNVISGYKMKFEKRNTKIKELTEEINSKTLDRSEYQRRIKILEELERNLDGFNYAVKQVCKAADRSEIKGIHGPVSRLIEVKSEYSTAIETALGASAQNIVVSNEDVAKKAIHYLKTNNAGRATFLPLTSIKPYSFKDESVKNCLGFVGFADKLVNTKSEYKDIISSLLGRTVITETIDNAVSMAKKYSYKFKIVTLDGQVVNPGGSLTGGSTAKNAGLINRSSQIEQFKTKIDKLNKEIAALSRELDDLNSKSESSNLSFEEKEIKLKQANEDKIRLLGELKLLEEQYNTNKANLDNLKLSKENSSQRTNDLNNKIKLYTENLTKFEIEKEQLEKSIDLLLSNKDKLSGVKSEITDKISAIRYEIVGYNKDIENLKESINQIEQTKNDRAGRITSLNEEISLIQQKKEQEKEEIERLTQISSGFISKSESSEDEIKRLTEKRTQIEQENYASRNIEREKSQDKERLSGELARLTERKDTIEKQYSDIITKLFDEYELTKSQAEEIGFPIDDIPSATKRLNEIKSKIRSLGAVNVSAIEEYKEVSERYEYMLAQITDVEKSAAELKKIISGLTSKMQEMFIEKFTVIAKNFTEVFKELFGGGTAKLQLTNPDDVLESGIDIIAQPPGKNISIIEQLSGGEKALIAVSIYFAIMKVNPPPFCLLDEVEAALDEVNVDKVAAYLRRMSSKTQFIVITHRRGTMEEADVLYGVTMQEKGVSKLLSINVSEIEKTLKTKVVN